MNLQLLVATVFMALAAGAPPTVDYDQIEPFPEKTEFVTISEIAAYKFRPQMHTRKDFCVPFPAVNAAGEVSDGLMGLHPNDACRYAPKGGQVYVRAGWYKGLWAIMYSWYYPKVLNWLGFQERQHDWKNAVVWIDNPAVKTPKIVGVAMSKSDTEYRTKHELDNSNFDGFIDGETEKKPYDPTSNLSLRFTTKTSNLIFADSESESDDSFQDLIMWEDLTDAARVALNNKESFGDVEVPFNDENFKDHLDAAWPF